MFGFVVFMAEMKLFNKWDVSGVKVQDPGLKDYICLTNAPVPRSSGRNAKFRFYKSKNNIVERLMNKLMVTGHKGKKHKVSSGHMTGKVANVYNIVLKALGRLEKQTNKNPIEVLVKAIENAAPRDEVTSIEYGGARYAQAVEVSPQRRVDLVLRMFTQGAYQKSFDSKIKIQDALADEISKAYNNDPTSQAISKKFELERQADSSR